VKALKIPLGKFSQRTLIWKFSKKMESNVLDLQDCLLFNKANDVDTSFIPKIAQEYYLSVPDPRQRLLFMFIPHVLTVDPIEVLDCEIIQVS
jgi:hypothetical protein